LIVQDFEELNIENSQIVAKLLKDLKQFMQKGIIKNQLHGFIAYASRIILFIGFAADFSNRNQVQNNLFYSFD
tara:strand:+ start:564 stop:782 length:219 start_codon:yes stop_codon:yes gene_type:complete